MAELDSWHGAPQQFLVEEKRIDRLFNATIMMAPVAQ